MELTYAVPCFHFFKDQVKSIFTLKYLKAEISFFHILILNLENAQLPLNKSSLRQIQRQRPLTDMHQYFSKIAPPLLVMHLHLNESQKSKKDYSKNN